MRALRALVLLAATVLPTLGVVALAAHATCCTAGHRVAHATVVSTGAALAEVHRVHQAVYVRATDELRESVRARGGSLAEYEALVIPVDAEFTARSEAIATLDAALYGASAILDAAQRGDPASWRAAAGPVLDALVRVLEALAEGHVLPPVPIPPAVRDTVRALMTLAGGPRPGPALQSDGGVQ